MNKEKQLKEMYDYVYKAINNNSVIDIMHGGYVGIDTEGLTKELYDAGYRLASEVAEEIFEEIEEGIKAAVSALQFENNPIHRKVKHETYSSLMRFVKSVEKKYTGEDTNVTTKEIEGI